MPTNPPAHPNRPAPPTGLRRRLARLPISVYRAGLGGLFGRRLLLLTHTGRSSGRPRQVVLEVVAHDPRAATWTLASGFGPRADWYRNLRRTPHATIRTGRRDTAVTAEFLPPEEGAEVMARYAHRNPRLAARLLAFMGYESDGGEADHRAAGASIPFVRLRETAGAPPR
ncbi:nitroreductase family deazaflavin-dependent oxidoreductase [Streptomyces zingiberis]|uniref:Nitroreductase family deazaflavin-dependent oxidoreductase n=1 Tax=Streptomyces zingiberis TaxID=2053010 RepID=A0ABX1BQR5_9ACTN|nr:nitroreductase family deazaflavin-dependent oxidoreductase [Streptomyces zingiberis]NJQ00075.1 nitroreductase family deazaflavin-dependent oxidoreductase [Streptomyces zingiberis]